MAFSRDSDDEDSGPTTALEVERQKGKVHQRAVTHNRTRAPPGRFGYKSEIGLHGQSQGLYYEDSHEFLGGLMLFG